MKQIKRLTQLIKANLERKKKMFFFFDYDGVLAPIQDNPATAYLKAKTKGTLLKLSSNPLFKVAIVSGRDLGTLKKLTRIKTNKVTLVGSHGLEMLLQGEKKFLLSKNSNVLRRIKSKVINLAKLKAKGFVENKPHTITYHVRDSREENLVKTLSKALNQLLTKLTLKKQIQVLEGKNIVEVMPREVTKGKAVERVIKLYPNYLPIYLGDDVTDISAFKAVEKYKGISVSLNPRLSYKANFIFNSKDMLAILNTLV